MGIQDNAKPQGGYTAPDNTRRCKKCVIPGSDIGFPIGEYLIACELPDGKNIHIGKVERCINSKTWNPDTRKYTGCEDIIRVHIFPAGHELNITESGIRACIATSRGYWYTLSELKGGQLELKDNPGYKEAVKPMPKPIPPDYNESAERAVDDIEIPF